MHTHNVTLLELPDIMDHSGATFAPAITAHGLLEAWVDLCLKRSEKHDLKAKKLKKIGLILQLSQLIIVCSLTITAGVCEARREDCPIGPITIIQSSVVALLLGLLQAIDPASKRKDNLLAAGCYATLARDIQTTVEASQMPNAAERDWQSIVREYQRRIDCIEVQAPPL